jgi:hypothetical protein
MAVTGQGQRIGGMMRTMTEVVLSSLMEGKHLPSKALYGKMKTILKIKELKSGKQ